MITNVSMLNEPPTCAHYTLSLHDALPIYHHDHRHRGETRGRQLDRFRDHHVLRTSSWAPSTFAARQHQVSVITRAGHPNGKRSPTTAPGPANGADVATRFRRPVTWLTVEPCSDALQPVRSGR